jgi:hypothetical protein
MHPLARGSTSALTASSIFAPRVRNAKGKFGWDIAIVPTVPVNSAVRRLVIPWHKVEIALMEES